MDLSAYLGGMMQGMQQAAEDRGMAQSVANQQAMNHYVWALANSRNYAYLPYQAVRPSEPECEYCGRKQVRPENGGCVSCGAPLP